MKFIIYHHYKHIISRPKILPVFYRNTHVHNIKKIPGPINLPIVGNLHYYKLGLYNVFDYHNVLTAIYKKYGKIARQELGPNNRVIHLFDLEDIKKVYQNEGKMPRIMPLQETTQIYRKMKEYTPGLGFMNGDEWYKLRRAVRKMMLRPQDVSYYLPFVNQVTTDFVKEIDKRKNSQGLITNLLELASKWNQESSGMICFEKRLGCLSGDHREKIAEQMIRANRKAFYYTGILKFSLPVYQYLQTPKWKKIVECEDFFYSYAMTYIKDAIKNINNVDNKKYNFLTYLLGRDEITQKDIEIITFSLFSDGLSTTAPALVCILYCLATNPEIQEKAYQEINSNTKREENITIDIINKMNYLKAVISESFRFYPTGTEISRLLDSEMEVSEYLLPANTHVNLNPHVHFMSNDYFDDPEKFEPERWIRKDGERNINPFLFIPFGFGVRSCVGRRFAEQDLYVVLIKILQNFKLKYLGEKKLKQVYNNLLFPEEPVKIQFILR